MEGGEGRRGMDGFFILLSSINYQKERRVSEFYNARGLETSSEFNQHSC